MANDLLGGGGGGGGDGGTSWFDGISDVSRADIEEALKSNVSDYLKPAGGGLVAWGILSEDLAAASAAVVGAGISQGIAGFFNANLWLLEGVIEFPGDFIRAVTTGQTAAITDSFVEAAAAVRGGGIASWLLVVVEIVVLMYLSAKAIEYARSTIFGGSSG